MFGRDAGEIGDSYRELASLVDAGYPLIQGLEFFVQRKGPGSATATHPAGELIRRLRSGGALHAAMAQQGFPRVDVAILRAAEETGRIPEGARLLSQYYGERHEMARTLRAAMIKPALLVLATFVLVDLPSLVGGDLSPGAYCLRTLGRFAILAGAGYASLRAFRSRGTRLVARVPVLGELAEAIAQENFFTCVRLGFRSGCDFRTVMALAEDVTDDPGLREAAGRIGALAGRVGIAEAFAGHSAFRLDQIQALRVGEATGKLDDAFARISGELRERVRRGIAALGEWLPRIVYGLAMAYAAYRVLGFYRGYFSMLEQF